jgi:hypothetical protein
LLDASMRASERTQRWLDAVWDSAIENESAPAILNRATAPC